MPIPRRCMHWLVGSSVFLAVALLAPSPARALNNGQCYDCHGDAGILSWSPKEKASNVSPGGPKAPEKPFGKFPGMSLQVDPARYKASVHSDLSCTDCHADIKDLPHTQRLKKVECSGCHSEVSAAYAKSRHAVTVDRKPVVNGPGCSDCHGAHEIPKHTLSPRRSTTGT